LDIVPHRAGSLTLLRLQLSLAHRCPKLAFSPVVK
jgi:hypothetical protein